MYISRFEIRNYKSYLQSGAIDLKPGFNVITGQNNAGKTALVEALSLNFPDAQPHRTLASVPYSGHPLNNTSSVDLSLTVEREEFRRIVEREGPSFYFALPQPGDPFGNFDHSDSSARILMQRLLEPDSLTFAVSFAKTTHGIESLSPFRLPSYGIYSSEGPASSGTVPFFQIAFSGGVFRGLGSSQQGPSHEIGTVVASVLKPRIYRVTAERYNVAVGQAVGQILLQPDAGNLPQVLASLQGRNPARFDKLNHLLRDVFPQLKRISVRPIGGNQVEIIVWMIDPALEREDLAISLRESGTGLGQVLAILYVVLTADHPQVILIDEPQSFLHPGALRKLIDILRAYSQHQYILATHSPAVITASNPATITSVSTSGGQSTLQSVDTSGTAGLQACLADVGARLADVFGADNVLWVEGKTEELCFPRILERIIKRPLMGTVVVGVTSTGNLERRDVEQVLGIYSRLSSSTSLLPPAVGFIFDRECRTPEKMLDLVRTSRDRLRFIPRRMFENYLIQAHAIASVGNAIEGFRPDPVRLDEVEAVIREKRNDRALFCQGRGPDDADWVTHIDGARLLEAVFAALSEARVSFRKVEHSVALTDWLISNQPEALRDIADALRSALVDS